MSSGLTLCQRNTSAVAASPLFKSSVNKVLVSGILLVSVVAGFRIKELDVLDPVKYPVLPVKRVSCLMTSQAALHQLGAVLIKYSYALCLAIFRLDI